MTHIQEMAERLHAFILQYKQERKEVDRLIRELELNAILMAQDINPKDIKSLSYDPLHDKRRNQLGLLPEEPVINKVTLVDGGVIILKTPIPWD